MRLSYWDSIKGVAIIAVIMIHATNASLKFPVDSFNWIFGLSLRQIINFAVPIFFAIAGLFSLPKIGQSGSSFIKKRFLRLIPIYIIWTLIYIIIFKHDHFYSFKKIFLDFFLGSGVGIGYFVIVLMQFILITPLIWKLKTIKSHIIIMISLFVISMIYRYVVGIYYSESFIAHFPYTAILFITWYPFYHFGIFAGMYRQKIENFVKQYKQIIIIMLIISFFMSLLEGYLLGIHELTSLGASQVKISSYFTAFLLFTLLLYLHFDKKEMVIDNKYLAWLGNYSYIIYLSHIGAQNVLGYILRKNDLLYNFQPAYIILLSILTLLSCILMILVMKKILNPKISKYIGL